MISIEVMSLILTLSFFKVVNCKSIKYGMGLYGDMCDS